MHVRFARIVYSSATCIGVDELEVEHKRFLAAGLQPGNIVELNRDGKPLAVFFFVSDPDGYKIEVLQRRGRYQ